MARLLILLTFLFISCGSEHPCAPYSDGSAAETELLDEAAEIMVAAGYDRPCCPVTFCHPGEGCMNRLGDKYCGLATGLGSDCTEILVATPWSNPICPDPMDTIFHEWLHAAGMDDGPALRKEVARLMIWYLEGWLESSGR